MADRELDLDTDTSQVDDRDSSAEAESIYRQIDRTRDSMDRTLDELQRRVSPSYIAHTSMQNIREATSNMYRATLDTIKEHPVPAAIAGFGLAFLIGCSIRDRARSGHSDRSIRQSEFDGRFSGGEQEQHRSERGLFQSAKETATHAAHSAKESLSHAKDSVMDRSRRIAHGVDEVRYELQDKVQSGYVATRDAVEHSFRDHPLLVGAGVLAAGVVLGTVLPSSRKEDELFGEYRDDLVDTAKDRVKRAARVAAKTASQAASRESLDDPARLAAQMRGGVLRREDSSAKDVGAEVGRRAGAVVGEAVDAAKEQITSSSTARQSKPSQSPFQSTGADASPKSPGVSRPAGGM